MTWFLCFPERNPFGEDEDEGEETPNSQHSSNTTASSIAISTSVNSIENYNDSLNPFAEDTEEVSNIEPASKQEMKKIIHTNPFEVSDEEDELPAEPQVEQQKKKLTPDAGLKAETKALRSSVRSKKGAAPRPPSAVAASPRQNKKTAPAPPIPTNPHPAVKSDNTSSNNKNTQHISAQQTPNSKPLPSMTRQSSTSLQELNESTPRTDSDIASPSSAQAKKHRPAPPRPMPPKRRVSSSLMVDSHSLSRSLGMCLPDSRIVQSWAKVICAENSAAA